MLIYTFCTLDNVVQCLFTLNLLHLYKLKCQKKSLTKIYISQQPVEYMSPSLAQTVPYYLLLLGHIILKNIIN